MKRLTRTDVDVGQYPDWAVFVPDGEDKVKIATKFGFSFYGIDQELGSEAAPAFDGLTVNGYETVGAGIIGADGETVTFADGTVLRPSYSLAMSTKTITRSRNGILTPNSISVWAYKNAADYYCRFRFDISYDGSSWALLDESTSDEPSKTVVIPATMEAGGNTYLVIAVKVTVFSPGGFTEILYRDECRIIADDLSSPIYWGALIDEPEDGFVAGDYYFDNNVPASGGGVLRYYDGTTATPWPVLSVGMSGYANAMNTAMPDIQQWVTTNPTAGGELVVAANAVFGSIAASYAFIDQLEATDLALTGTLRTGADAATDARVAIKDRAGVTSQTFLGSGTNDLSVVQDGLTEGVVTVTITEAQVGDTGPSGGKIVSLAPNVESAPSDLAASGWDAAVSAAAASTMGGKNDWVLPTRTQLQAMRAVVGASMQQIEYWTSESSGANAYAMDVYSGVEILCPKSPPAFVATRTLPASGTILTMLEYSGKLYFPQSGGNILFVYTISSRTWSSITMPSSMSRPSMGYYAGKLYFPQSGGNSLEVYDIAGNSFTTITMPHSIVRGAMFVDGLAGKLYFPENGNVYLEIYDVASGTWTTKIFPNSNWRSSVIGYRTSIYFPSGSGVYMHKYNTLTETFTTITMPHDMIRNTATENAGKLYFPQHNGTYLEVYDVTSGSWSTIPMPNNMSRMTMGVYAQKLYFPENGGTKLEVYDLGTTTWSTVVMPHSMSRYTMVASSADMLYFPEMNGTLLEVCALYNFISRPVRTNTETKRWKHKLDAGSDVAHGVIASGAVYDTAIDIKISWANINGHVVGDQWTLVQEAMRGLSIKDASGVEYLEATDGEVNALINVGGTPTMAQVGAGIVADTYENNSHAYTFGNGTILRKGHYENYRRRSIYQYISGVSISNQYIHMKTNHLLAGTHNMPMFQFRGYSYGEAKPVNCSVVYYNYADAVYSAGYYGSHVCGVYRSSDGYAVLTLYVTATYYLGFLVDLIGAGPQGLLDILITASTNSSATTGVY